MKVLITADKTTVSDFKENLFIGGFISCLPKTPFTSAVFNHFNPWCESEKGIFKYAPLTLRKIESVCHHNNINSLVVRPDYLKKYAKDGDWIAMSVVDPLGLGPVPTMISVISEGQNFLQLEFEKTMKQIRAVKDDKDVKVVVGGPGAQFVMDNKSMKKFGIDYVYLSEAETGLPQFLKKPEKIFRSRIAKPEEILPIINPTDGRVEISRSCGRMCSFCSPTESGKMRQVGIDQILKEVRVNTTAGRNRIVLQSEDFLLYGAKNFVPQTDVQKELFTNVFRQKGVKEVFPMHFSYAAVLANPDAAEAITKIARQNGQKYFVSQPGLETGSNRLMEEVMFGKKLPFRDMDWAEVVLESFKIINKLNWKFVTTLILGLPGETVDDIKETIDLVEKLVEYKGNLFVPLFFSPSNKNLKDRKRFIEENMGTYHWRLYELCWKHNLKMVDDLLSPQNSAKYEEYLRLNPLLFRSALEVLKQKMFSVSRKHLEEQLPMKSKIMAALLFLLIKGFRLI